MDRERLGAPLADNGSYTGDQGVHERTTMHFQNDAWRGGQVDWSRLQAGEETQLIRMFR